MTLGIRDADTTHARVCAHCPTPHSQVRLGLPAAQWITVYNAHRPMKQRYHYNVANSRVEQHVEKGNDDGLYISSVACCQVWGGWLTIVGVLGRGVLGPVLWYCDHLHREGVIWLVGTVADKKG